MLRVGLTGSLGSGKSTVARLFAIRGAHILEADAIGREMMQPGQPVYDANRQNRIATATGWMPGRFTWRQVRFHPKATARELAALLKMGRRRLLVSTEG